MAASDDRPPPSGCGWGGEDAPPAAAPVRAPLQVRKANSSEACGTTPRQFAAIESMACCCERGTGMHRAAVCTVPRGHRIALWAKRQTGNVLAAGMLPTVFRRLRRRRWLRRPGGSMRRHSTTTTTTTTTIVVGPGDGGFGLRRGGLGGQDEPVQLGHTCGAAKGPQRAAVA